MAWGCGGGAVSRLLLARELGVRPPRNRRSRFRIAFERFLGQNERCGEELERSHQVLQHERVIALIEVFGFFDSRSTQH